MWCYPTIPYHQYWILCWILTTLFSLWTIANGTWFVVNKIVHVFEQSIHLFMFWSSPSTLLNMYVDIWKYHDILPIYSVVINTNKCIRSIFNNYPAWISDFISSGSIYVIPFWESNILKLCKITNTTPLIPLHNFINMIAYVCKPAGLLWQIYPDWWIHWHLKQSLSLH